jgi:hypothetical protein
MEGAIGNEYSPGWWYEVSPKVFPGHSCVLFGTISQLRGLPRRLEAAVNF